MRMPRFIVTPALILSAVHGAHCYSAPPRSLLRLQRGAASRRSTRSLLSSNFYDDFQDFGEPGSDDGGTNRDASSLNSRMTQVRGAEAAYDAKLARNWRRGNWSVRGFALNKSPFASSSSATDAAETPVVSAVAAPTSSSYTDVSLPQDRALPEDRTVAVGRTDGSVFVVKLGEQYLTTFMSVPKLVVEQDNDGPDDSEGAMSVRVENTWMDSNEVKSKLEVEQPLTQPSSGESETEMAQEPNPFEITHQFLASDHGPIHRLVYHDAVERDGCDGVVFTAAGSSGEITMWLLPPSGIDHGASQSTHLNGVHHDEIVSLEVITLRSRDDANESTFLFSASRDGTIALWDIENGELALSCQCIDAESGASLTCADVSNPTTWDDGWSGNENVCDVIFLGTSDGYVVGYVVEELIAAAGGGTTISGDLVPDIRFRAHGTDSGKGDAVTAIKCGGDGTIPTSARLRGGESEAKNSFGRNSRLSSSILLTGGEDGSIKQWEILSQSTSTKIRLEHWPRIPSQRMKRRSHLFMPGHDGAVTGIAQQSRYDSSKFLTCGQDGSVCVWSASSGKELFRMDGFESTISSLACLGRDLIVTDGMDEFVCVHDFGIEEDAASKGYDLEW